MVTLVGIEDSTIGSQQKGHCFGPPSIPSCYELVCSSTAKAGQVMVSATFFGSCRVHTVDGAITSHLINVNPTQVCSSCLSTEIAIVRGRNCHVSQLHNQSCSAYSFIFKHVKITGSDNATQNLTTRIIIIGQEMLTQDMCKAL